MEAINVELFGSDPKILKAIQFAQNVAVTKAPILIVGEIGTGKKTMSRYIHSLSSRANNFFEVIDCAEDIKVVEDKILGHRDPDTGRFNKGVLERGNGGTVIFANIDALNEEFQKKIHKILQELSDYEIDLRIISTTTKNLSKLVGAGRFYRGLYTYLSGTQILIPPLRERETDIKSIAEGLITNYCIKENRPIATFSEDGLKKLVSHYWTHNVSELQSVLENSLANNTSGVLDIQDLSIGERKTVSMIAESDDDGIKLMSLKEAERLLIKKALIHTSENRTQAAKILGVSIRTLRNKINEYRGENNTFFVNLR